MVGNAAGAGTDGVLSAAGEGRAYQALGSVIRVKASGQETGNAMEVFESDFPHPTCLYPNPVERAFKALEHWGPEVQRKVMGGNAARIYNL